MGGVAQHDLTKIDGGWRTVDFAFKTLFYQQGQIAGMIHVRMGNQYRVDEFRVMFKMLIFSIRLGASALKEPAFNQNSFVVDG